MGVFVVNTVACGVKSTSIYAKWLVISIGWLIDSFYMKILTAFLNCYYGYAFSPSSKLTTAFLPPPPAVRKEEK